MSERTSLRSGGAIGIAWVVIAFGGVTFASGSRWTEFLELFAGGLSLWWIASLWSYLQSREPGPGALSMLLLLGWVVALAIEFISYATGALQAARPAGSSALAAYVGGSRTFWNLASQIPLAISLLAAGLLIVLTRAFPLWVGFLGLVSGLAMFSLAIPIGVDVAALSDTGPIFGLAQLIFVVWLVALSVLMILKSRVKPETVTGTTV